MELLIFCLLCSVGLAVSGSLTFWPVQNWWDFYIPIVLAIAGYVVAMLIIILCYTIFGLFIDQKKEYKKVSRFAAFWFVLGVKYVNLLAGVRLKVIGKEKLPKNQRFVMVCNHRSNFDPMVTAVALAKYDLAFITKKDNQKIPWGGKLFHGMCYLPIDRDDLLQSLSQFKRAADLIQTNACSIGVYPEGKRQHETMIGEFHEGPFNIAIKANVPIVIMTIKNSELISKRFPKSTKVILEVVGVIPAEEIQDLPAKQVSEMVHKIMVENLSK